MSADRKPWWFWPATLVAAVAAGLGGWGYKAWVAGPEGPSSNAIMVITPYWYEGTWVFDDPAVGLRREPFVAGVPEMIDLLVKDIPDAREGFRLLFSAHPFPGKQKTLTRLRGDSGGNYYQLDNPPMEGWICPAMFRYYKEAAGGSPRPGGTPSAISSLGERRCSVSSTVLPLSDQYRDAIRFTLFQQVPCALLCLLMLDGGRMAKICGCTMAGFWVVVAIIMLRRPLRPTAGDLLFARWGFPMLLMVAVILAPWFG